MNAVVLFERAARSVAVPGVVLHAGSAGALASSVVTSEYERMPRCRGRASGW